MGKGQILSEYGAGKYSVRLLLDQTRADSRIAAIDDKITKLNAQLALLTPGTAEYNRVNLEITVNEKQKETIQKYEITNPEQDLWCADYSQGLTGDVGTIEIPGERVSVNIQPGYDGNAEYDQTRDGQMQPAISSVPAQIWWNWAMLPGWQKWKPTYRYGTITSIDYENDKCDVILDSAYSSAQDLEINQTGTLEDVDIEYMECNSSAFQVSDEVVVKFEDQDWTKPKVIGFKDNPKPCEQYLVIRIGGIAEDERRYTVWDIKENQVAIIEGVSFPCAYADLSSWLSGKDLETDTMDVFTEGDEAGESEHTESTFAYVLDSNSLMQKCWDLECHTIPSLPATEITDTGVCTRQEETIWQGLPGVTLNYGSTYRTKVTFTVDGCTGYLDHFCDYWEQFWEQWASYFCDFSGKYFSTKKLDSANDSGIDGYFRTKESIEGEGSWDTDINKGGYFLLEEDEHGCADEHDQYDCWWDEVEYENPCEESARDGVWDNWTPHDCGQAHPFYNRTYQESDVYYFYTHLGFIGSIPINVANGTCPGDMEDETRFEGTDQRIIKTVCSDLVVAQLYIYQCLTETLNGSWVTDPRKFFLQAQCNYSETGNGKNVDPTTFSPNETLESAIENAANAYYSAKGAAANELINLDIGFDIYK